MREAVIVSTARTPIGKAYRGAFNATTAPRLIGHAIEHAVARARVDPAEVEDVVVGAALQQGTTHMNIGRTGLLRAGLPVTVPGQSVDRQCASGLMAIAIAAKEIISDGMAVTIGGGVEQISLVQTPEMNTRHWQDPWISERLPATYMAMVETAEIVARRNGVSREAQDAYALQSQQRTAAAQAAGRFDDEIVPLTTVMQVTDRETGEINQIWYVQEALSSGDVRKLAKEKGDYMETVNTLRRRGRCARSRTVPMFYGAGSGPCPSANCRPAARPSAAGSHASPPGPAPRSTRRSRKRACPHAGRPSSTE